VKSPAMTDTEKRPLDYRRITDAQRQMWASGDFSVIARQVVSVSEGLCQAADPRPGQRVLDLACGSGNAALAAARRYCDVTGVDYVPALIERAKERAAAQGTRIQFELGDAQALRFTDASFDVVLSAFGVMFAADQQKAARELLRVCRPGGCIALACWMPEGWGGELIAIHERHAPPPPGLAPPVRWGTEEGITELLGPVSSVSFERRTVFQYFFSIDHGVTTFRACFGPTSRAFETLDRVGQEAMRNDLTALFQKYNRAPDATVAVECQYLQVIVRR
jgi:ubiquinone/menaquinone biosynthesis C-methylase UbiE